MRTSRSLLSIRNLLAALIGTLGLLLMVLSGVAVQDAWQRHTSAQRVSTLIRADKVLFQVLQMTRLERGGLVPLLRSPAPDSTVLAEVKADRAAAEQGYTLALAATANLDLAELPMRRDQLTTAHEDVVRLRRRVDDAVAQPLSARDGSLAAAWMASTDAMLASVERLSTRLEREATLVDPIIDQLLLAKRAAWEVRSNAGHDTLMVNNAISAGHALTPAQHVESARYGGEVASAWAAVKQVAGRPELPDGLAKSVAAAQQAYFSGPTADRRATVMNALFAGTPATISLAEWQAGETPALESLANVVTTALDLVGARARAQVTAARGALLIHAAVLVLAAALAVGGFIAVYRRITRPIATITSVMGRLAEGDLTADVPGVGRRDEIGAMAGAVQVFKTNAVLARTNQQEQDAARERRAAEDEQVRRDAEAAAAAEAAAMVVGSIGAGLEQLAAGDLSVRLETELPEAYEKLRRDFNAAVARLQDAIRGIAANTQAVRSGTGEIAGAADDLSRRTEQQAATLEQTAAALEQITTTVRHTAEGTRQARDVVGKAREDATRSGTVVQNAVSAMSEIERSAEQIGQIIGVIDEIAFQTSLLALNAGVEAARAGDAGRGFAVVASEVRALAQRSAEAAKEIKALISTSSQQVSRGVELVGETGQALGRIVAEVTEVDTVITAIAASAQEQATGLVEINTAINQMDQVTQQNAAMVEETTAAAHALAREAEELARLTGRFRTGEPDASDAPRRVVPFQPARSAPRRQAVASTGARPRADDWEEF